MKEFIIVSIIIILTSLILDLFRNRLNMSIYWNRYYTIKRYNKPSDFAKYVIKKGYITKKDIVIDIACGNGRDTKYFENKCKNIIGMDNSDNAVFSALKFCKKPIIIKGDYQYWIPTNTNVIYMRWFLHAVNKDIAYKCLNNSHKGLKKGGYLLIEARYGKNSILNWNPFHYRRLIDEETCFELKKLGFKIIECNIGKNFSKMGNNNPDLIRIICQKV